MKASRPAHLANAIGLLRPLAEPAPLPAGLTDKQLHAALAQRVIPAAADALQLLRAVAAEFDQPRPGMNGVTTPDKRGEVGVCRLRRLQGCAGAAMLALDGTGDPEMVRHLFGARMEHVECRVERDAHVTSPTGKGYSRQSLSGTDKFSRPIAGKQASAKRLREDVATIVRQQPGRCLVVAAEAAEAALIEHLPFGHPDDALRRSARQERVGRVRQRRHRRAGADRVGHRRGAGALLPGQRPQALSLVSRAGA